MSPEGDKRDRQITFEMVSRWSSGQRHRHGLTSPSRTVKALTKKERDNDPVPKVLIFVREAIRYSWDGGEFRRPRDRDIQR